MPIHIPASAFNPFFTDRAALFLSRGGGAPVQRVEVRCAIQLREPYQLGGAGSATALPRAATWEVSVPLSELPNLPTVGNRIAPISPVAPDTPARLAATAVHVNGEVCHITAEAQRGVAP